MKAFEAMLLETIVVVYAVVVITALVVKCTTPFIHTVDVTVVDSAFHPIKGAKVDVNSIIHTTDGKGHAGQWKLHDVNLWVTVYADGYRIYSTHPSVPIVEKNNTASTTMVVILKGVR